MSNIIYELAVVEDRGPYWQVTNVTKNTLESLANRDEKLLKLSYVTYEKIVEAIKAGNIVRIPKTLQTDEVLPHELDVVDAANDDPLLSARSASLAKVRMLITPELSKISGLALYGFTVLNNDMIAAGFVITKSNREEKYLEILETGDEELINKLEDYLNYKDEIERVAQLERKFSTFQKAINNATEEEVGELENKFLEDFYQNY